MGSRKRMPLSLCLALTALLLSTGVRAEMFSPLRVELDLPQFPELGREAVLGCNIESRYALTGVSLEIDLPPGIELVDGSKTWYGDMVAFQVTPLRLTIKATSPGNKTITATVFCRVDENTAYSDVSQIFFHTDADFAVEGHVTDVVPTMAAAGCLETGEIAEPMKLADYMMLPAEAPYEPEPCSIGPGEPPAESGPTPSGLLTVSGRWYYFARNDAYTPMNWVFVELRRGDTDAVLTSAWITDDNGRYTFPAVTNPGAAGFRVRAWCYHNNTNSCDGKALRVVGVGDGRSDGGNTVSPCYSVQTAVRTSGDGSYDMGTWHVNNGDTNEPAWWIMMDLNQGFWWPYWWNDHTTMNGGVTVEWSSTSTHGDHNHGTDDGGNIHLRAASPNVCDVVLHEYGHEVQWDGYGQWLPTSDCPSPHYFELAGGSNCAWYEGFANWFKFAVTNDPVYHWPGGGTLNCETPTWGTTGWDDGDLVEGRTAGALWDFGDSNADGYDTCQLNWEYIWDTWYGSANRDNTFAQFWTRWKNKFHPKHHATKALYQNTIDYNTWPTFGGLPDVTTTEDTPKNNAFDLWLYASDSESDDAELDYAITGNTNPSCGVSIDAGDYVDVNPALNWHGSSTVTISCTDGIRTVYDSFVVTVTPVNDPPAISGLPDRTVLEDHSWNNAIDLWAYTYDPETADSGLTFSITGNTNANCGVSIDSNRYIDINPASGWHGYSDVTVRATDPSGLWSADTFRITVTSVNDPPIFTGLPDRTLNEDSTWDNAINLWNYASDETPDADLLFTITGNTNASCGVSIDSNRYIDINPAANWNGYSDVTVRCTDTGGLWAEDTFRITALPVNDPPTLAYLPDRLVGKNSSVNNAIDLWPCADDEETADWNLVYTITGNTDPNCGVSIDASDFVDINPAANWTGYSDVTIRATDEGGLWAEDTFRVIGAEVFDTIAQARAHPDGTWVAVRYKVATGAFPSYYYIQEPDRSSGMRVAAGGHYGPGYEMTVAGTLGTSFAERQIVPYYQQYTNEGIWLQPLGMINRSLGGKAPDNYTMSVPNEAAGPYNVGLLVRTTGRVIQHASGNRYYIADGSSTIDNATGVPSVMVYPVPSGYKPPVGSYVTVTGISGASTLSGQPLRILRPRDDSDIQIDRLQAAFVYYDNPLDARSFKHLLDSNSVPTDMIYIKDLASVDWSKYHVVLVGGDTGSWSIPDEVNAVLGAGTPIVAIGSGGARFLDAVTTPDLYVGWLNSRTALNETNAFVHGGDIYTYPHNLGVGYGQRLTIYKPPGTGIVSLYDLTGVTNRMLREDDDQNHFPLASELGRFYQWGFYDGPDKMTDLGRRLFVNLVFSTVR